MNPTFKQVTKTRYVQLVAELAQEIFVQHYTKLTPKVAAALADKYGIPVIDDGGIKYSGDIVTALAAGGAHEIQSPFRRQPPLREDAENTGRIDV